MIVNNGGTILNCFGYFSNRKRLPSLFFYKLPCSFKYRATNFFLLPYFPFYYTHLLLPYFLTALAKIINLRIEKIFSFLKCIFKCYSILATLSYFLPKGVTPNN